MSLRFIYNKDLSKTSELKQKYLSQQVLHLKNLYQPSQKSDEWYKARSELLTASDLGSILEENSYNSPNSVLLKKIGYDDFQSNSDMVWGNKYEQVAQNIYESRNKTEVIRFGLLKHNSIPYLGASPDGITSDGVMLEIKCPSKRQITGIPKSYYLTQVLAQLEVCDLDRCDFLECNFKEYNSEEKYFSDKKFRSEKGVIGKFESEKDKSIYYEYSPINISYTDLQVWKKKHKNNKLIGYDYWYLDKISCLPIYRNYEWFNNTKDKLEMFWNKVLKYKSTGLESLKNDIEDELNTLNNINKNALMFFDLKNYFSIKRLENDLEYINNLLQNKKRSANNMLDNSNINKNIVMSVKKRRIN